MFAYGKNEDAFHLLAGDHTGFIHDQDTPAERGLGSFIFQQPRYGHSLTKADFLQFFDRTPCRSDSDYPTATFTDATSNLLERSCLSSASGAAEVHRKIARVKDVLDHSPLFFAETLGRLEVVLAPKAIISIHSAVDCCDDSLFTLQAVTSRETFPDPKYRALSLALIEELREAGRVPRVRDRSAKLR
jgi:hypothetical protein